MPSKPWLTVAVFCESVLKEDTEVISLIRITEKLTVVVPTGLSKSVRMVANTMLYLTFRTEEGYEGQHIVGIEAFSPDGKPMKNTIPEMPIAFIGGNTTGANARISLDFSLAGEGLYWIEVSLDKQLCARVPLRIAYAIP